MGRAQRYSTKPMAMPAALMPAGPQANCTNQATTQLRPSPGQHEPNEGSSCPAAPAPSPPPPASPSIASLPASLLRSLQTSSPLIRRRPSSQVIYGLHLQWQHYIHDSVQKLSPASPATPPAPTAAGPSSSTDVQPPPAAVNGDHHHHNKRAGGGGAEGGPEGDPAGRWTTPCGWTIPDLTREHQLERKRREH
jgi:hypothetical protein